ncbi:MAG TPA: cysteine desulfurase family protein [Oscillospiraceae bacterium]|nr:cysteine desulfurase family protein [Oscillospiraceae bacterium]
MERIVYLDNAATAPLLPAALSAMREALEREYGNPSSRYPLGTRTAGLIRTARADVAALLGCAPDEIFFTSGGTEGDNHALLGAAEALGRRGRHIVTTAVEHAAVLETAKYLESKGFQVTYLKPDRRGEIALSALEEALRPDTILVSMMLVNNELGTVFPVAEAAELLRKSGSGALLHTDAVQAVGKTAFTIASLGADLVTVSAHKLGGPKGAGALFVRRGVRIPPLLHGGGQENGMRSGTEATHQILGLAAACRVWNTEGGVFRARLADLNAYARETLSNALPELVFLADGGAGHILPLSLPGYKSEVLVRFLGDRGVCVSAGSACHRGRASHVYAALGLSRPVRDGAFRVSFSPANTKADIDALRDGLLSAKSTLLQSM